MKPTTALFMLTACTAPSGTATLTLSSSPSSIPSGSASTIRAVAQTKGGTLGTGRVRFESEFGSLVTPAFAQLDEFGTAEVAFVCDAASDPTCATAQKATITGRWLLDGVAVTGSTSVRLTGGNGGSAGGGSANSAGGTSGGAGPGGGTSLSDERVQMIGPIRENALPCWEVLADPRTPTLVQPSFRCDAVGATLNNGKVYYRIGALPGLFVFNPDPWDWNSASAMAQLPMDTKNADTQLYSECGDMPYRISRSGRVIHVCPGKGAGLFINGQAIGYDGGFPLAIGDADIFLYQDRVVVSSTGSETSIAPALNGTIKASVAVPAGFLVASKFINFCLLNRVSLTGVASPVGGFAVSDCSGYLDPAGRLTQIRYASNFATELWEAPPDGGAANKIYSEENATPNNLSVDPPSVYAKFSKLVGLN